MRNDFSRPQHGRLPVPPKPSQHSSGTQPVIYYHYSRQQNPATLLYIAWRMQLRRRLICRLLSRPPNNVWCSRRCPATVQHLEDRGDQWGFLNTARSTDNLWHSCMQHLEIWGNGDACAPQTQTPRKQGGHDHVYSQLAPLFGAATETKIVQRPEIKVRSRSQIGYSPDYDKITWQEEIPGTWIRVLYKKVYVVKVRKITRKVFMENTLQSDDNSMYRVLGWVGAFIGELDVTEVFEDNSDASVLRGRHPGPLGWA